ncbi:MAG: general stress protein [Chloroflexi bacterium]|nr:general stress protein [Chloroflexota bacterium]
MVSTPSSRRSRKGFSPVANQKRGPRPGSPQAKRGGQAVSSKYGRDYYTEIGKKGGRAVKEKHGADFYSSIGRKGGNTTKERQGSGFYSEIGRKGGSARRGEESE